jgi:four helix bundle protein
VPGAGAECRVLASRLPSSHDVAARRFQDLVAWQLANQLKKEVYELVETSTAREDRRFFDQIRDSAASAPSNLAEGFACYRHPDFARYVRMAKASLTETQNHLRDGVDRRHWGAEESHQLEILADRAIGACTLHPAPCTLHPAPAQALALLFLRATLSEIVRTVGQTVRCLLRRFRFVTAELRP